jgi:hypothetical protein
MSKFPPTGFEKPKVAITAEAPSGSALSEKERLMSAIAYGIAQHGKNGGFYFEPPRDWLANVAREVAAAGFMLPTVEAEDRETADSIVKRLLPTTVPIAVWLGLSDEIRAALASVRAQMQARVEELTGMVNIEAEKRAACSGKMVAAWLERDQAIARAEKAEAALERARALLDAAVKWKAATDKDVQSGTRDTDAAALCAEDDLREAAHAYAEQCAALEAPPCE